MKTNHIQFSINLLFGLIVAFSSCKPPYEEVTVTEIDSSRVSTIKIPAGYGILSVINKTATPKIFSITGGNDVDMKLTLSGNKYYLIYKGDYQVTYYSIVRLKEISRIMSISAGKVTTLEFYKTGTLDADFRIY